MDLAKSFEPREIEARWYDHWAAAGYFQPSGNTAQPAFCIQLPPPNVTGTLHMGHAFNQTIMDGLTRYHRMLGHNTLWLPGTDHAGIATQIVVERQLEKEGSDPPRPGPGEICRQGLGLERTLRKHHHPSRCGAWATRWTGAANTSLWTAG